MLPARSLPSATFRDLGGLSCRGGRTVAPKRFFRCGDPLLLDGPTRELFRAAKFQLVVDLRTSDEQAADVQVRDWGVTSIPLFNAIRPNWLNPSDQAPAATAKRYLEMLADGLDSIVRLVHLVAEHGSTPAVVHCAAGRDRTGIVVACVLKLLGADDEAIAADYALSDFSLDGARAHAETMRLFLASAQGSLGTLEALLRTRGLRPDIVSRLVTNLTIPSD
jgi:protein-tyrosine phosphatase